MGRSDVQVRISVAGETVVEGRRSHWMRMWEETSYQLERLQTNVDCAVQGIRRFVVPFPSPEGKIHSALFSRVERPLWNDSSKVFRVSITDCAVCDIAEED